jgi:hypothetical protein
VKKHFVKNKHGFSAVLGGKASHGNQKCPLPTQCERARSIIFARIKNFACESWKRASQHRSRFQELNLPFAQSKRRRVLGVNFDFCALPPIDLNPQQQNTNRHFDSLRQKNRRGNCYCKLIVYSHCAPSVCFAQSVLYSGACGGWSAAWILIMRPSITYSFFCGFLYVVFFNTDGKRALTRDCGCVSAAQETLARECV